MPVVKIEPTKEHSVPYDTTAQKTETLLDEIAVAGNTAELLVDLGAPLDVSEKDAAKEKELLNAVASAKKPANLKTPAPPLLLRLSCVRMGSNLLWTQHQPVPLLRIN